MRAVEVFLKVLIFDQLADSNPLFLTVADEAISTFTRLFGKNST
jgi:hypothetical protein